MSAKAAALGAEVGFVTGASRGVGFGVASRLAQDGARVALFARTAVAVAEAAATIGDRALPLVGNVADSRDVAQAVDRAEEQFGPITVMVHNAGTADVIGPLWEADPEAWWQEVAGHLRGAMLSCSAVIPSMVQRGRGRIILMYGDLGEGPDPWCSAYACGKAGLLRLVGQLDAELADTGVRVFGVHPGLVWTSMTADLARDPSKRRWLPRFYERPRERYGTAEAAADLVARIAVGDADDLAGLLLLAGDELDELKRDLDSIRADQRRTLRTVW